VDQGPRPNVAFLGACDRSLYQTLVGHPQFAKIDLYGLCNLIPCAFFPTTLQGFEFFFAVSGVHLLTDLEFRIHLPGGGGYLSFPFGITRKEPDEPETDSPVAPPETIELSPDWSLLVVRHKEDSGLVSRPGRCRVTFVTGGDEHTTGWLSLEHVPPPPLTQDRVDAILSNPAGVKTARMKFQCNHCHDSMAVYTGLERNGDYEKQGYVWYKELPDAYSCGCGTLRIDLTLLREHYHGVLGDVPKLGGKLDNTQRYQQSRIEGVCTAFAKLVSGDPPEEAVQQFIQNNTILLTIFGPKRIFFKPPLLTKHKADIGILNHKKELLLIELERPSLQILRQDGGICAELNKPLQQVNDWLHLAEEQRVAVLSCIGNLTLTDVSKVRGIIVAGTDKGYDTEQLRHFKWMDFGSDITVFTYDDLISYVVSLVRAVGNL
jgi:Domain of unknown function (DUF4263)